MGDALGSVRAHAAEIQAQVPTARDDSAALRRLDPRARRLLDLFRSQWIVTTSEMAAHLQLSPRTVTAPVRGWVADGFLEVHEPARKTRSYRLSPVYEDLVM